MTEEEKIDIIFKDTSFNKIYIKNHLEKCDWDVEKAKLSISDDLNKRFKGKNKLMSDKNQIDPWIEGQAVLIKDIQEKLRTALEGAEGVDLMLDVINILKEIRPIKREKL